jgi:hypothetical protein
MAANLLGTEEIHSNLEDLILEKTEGIPFFIEEFMRSLKELKIIEKKDGQYHLAKDIQDVTIPSTIQDVIMAKVDSLPDTAKELIQAGSAIEREFNFELIQRVTDFTDNELLSRLAVLKDSELLYERGLYPQSAYIFKHAITREIVYYSILSKNRKKLHEKIAKAFEELYKENIHEHYAVLGEHYGESQNYEKAAEYSRLAAEKAENTASLNDAIAHAKKAIACLEKLPQTDDVQKRMIDTRTMLGIYHVQGLEDAEAKEVIDPIVDSATRLDDKKALFRINVIEGGYTQTFEENNSGSVQKLETALKIAEEIQDEDSLYLANYRLGILQSVMCAFQKGFDHFQGALKIQVDAKNLWGIASVKSLLAYLVYYHQGKIELAYQTTTEAVVGAEESGDLYSKAAAYTCHGISCYGRGFFKEALEHLLQGVDFCEKTDNFFMNSIAQHFLGKVYFDVGEYRKSENHYHEAVWNIEQRKGVSSYLNLNKIGIARARSKDAKEEINLEQLSNYVCLKEDKIYQGRMPRYIAEILFNFGEQHFAESEKWIKKAIEADDKNGMMFYLGKDYTFYAELLKRKGDQSKAKENLNKGIEIFRECGADDWVKKTDKERGALSC